MLNHVAGHSLSGYQNRDTTVKNHVEFIFGHSFILFHEEIVKIISKFNQNKSPGHDGIGNLIVKNVAQSKQESRS